MENKNDNLDTLFKNLDGTWDLQQPDVNHYDRFLEKQHRKTKRKNYWTSISIAASILLLVGFFTFFNHNNNYKKESNDFEFASKQTRETDSIFTAMIRIELDKVKEKKSPLNEKIVADALIQMQKLDADYEKIKLEFVKNGESKQIIYAMIQNLKTRIAFLEEVLAHIENNEKFNNDNHENTI